MEEIWRDIKGYEGKYQVSNLGRVKSLYYKCKMGYNGKSKLLGIYKNRNNDYGYYFTPLNKNGKHKNFFIHRLVAEAFIPNPNNLPCVNHIDEDKSNNKVDNLEWCSYKYNVNYGTCKTRSMLKRSKPVIQYTKEGEFVKEWRSIKEAETSIGKRNGIFACLSGKSKTAGGFVWKRKE